MSKDFPDTPFDFNHNGELDDFEKRAQLDSMLNGIKEDMGIKKNIEDMSEVELSGLIKNSGIDISDTGI